LLVLLAGSGQLASDPWQRDAAALLRRAEKAEQRVAYVGTRVVHPPEPRGGDPVEHEVRVYHAPPDKTRLEVLPPTRIAGLITVDVGERRFHYYPWWNRWDSLPRPYKPPLELLLRNYSVREAGMETIAGRSARVVHIRPRHPGNRQKNVWVDRHTGVILKSELLDENGRRLSWWAFREISFPHVVSSAHFTPPAPAVTAAGGGEASAPRFQRIQKPCFSIVELRALPPGYTEVRRTYYRSRNSDSALIRYSDGLHVIHFVQQHPRSGEREHEGARAGEDGRQRPRCRG
jgi:outer membrane lipoprotein-sorting protein